MDKSFEVKRQSLNFLLFSFNGGGCEVRLRVILSDNTEVFFCDSYPKMQRPRLVMKYENETDKLLMS